MDESESIQAQVALDKSIVEWRLLYEHIINPMLLNSDRFSLAYGFHFNQTTGPIY